jgi:hypothetical protein
MKLTVEGPLRFARWVTNPIFSSSRTVDQQELENIAPNISYHERV